MTQAQLLAKHSSKWYLGVLFVIAGASAILLLFLWTTVDDHTSTSEEADLGGTESFVAHFVESFVGEVPRGTRFAVLPLTDLDNRVTYLGRYFTDILADEIAGSLGDAYDLIDRELTGTLKAIALSTWGDGLSDTETSPKLGRMMAPTMVVTGTVFATEHDLVIALKLVDIETGLVLSQASGTLALTATTRRIAAKGIANESPCLTAVAAALQENHKWLWAAVVAPFLAWMWKERKTLIAWLHRRQPRTRDRPEDEQSESSGNAH